MVRFFIFIFIFYFSRKYNRFAVIGKPSTTHFRRVFVVVVVVVVVVVGFFFVFFLNS